jgi:PPOX class probable F420-dependent enzyme
MTERQAPDDHRQRTQRAQIVLRAPRQRTRERDFMATTFDEGARRILDGKNFATVSTLNPDGAPQTSVVWFKREGEAVLFSTTTARQKARNLARDPRISLAIFDIDNPYDVVEIRGRAELAEDRRSRCLGSCRTST